MSETDPSKIAELQALMGADFEEIVGGLIRSIEANIVLIDEALDAGDLEAVFKAAHHCRNDALMVKASALLGALEAVEQGAREGRPEAVRGELARVRNAWPPVRDELEGLIGES